MNKREADAIVEAFKVAVIKAEFAMESLHKATDRERALHFLNNAKNERDDARERIVRALSSR